jgi:hypothetical protein
MILLPIILTPVGIAILLLVMSWTERTLDREPRPERTQPTRVSPAAAVAALAAVELAGLTEPLIAP